MQMSNKLNQHGVHTCAHGICTARFLNADNKAEISLQPVDIISHCPHWVSLYMDVLSWCAQPLISSYTGTI